MLPSKTTGMAPWSAAHGSSVLALVMLIGSALQASTPWDAPLPDAVPWEIGVAEYPTADAVILRWEQHWRVATDGTLRRRERRWTKLLSSRAIRAAADPRVDFNADGEQIVIHQAATRLPDGTLLPVPDYGINISAARGLAGWPAYAGWRQQVISFSGVAPGVTLILDYEVIGKTGEDWFEADLRLDDRFPIVERAASVAVPAGGHLLTAEAHLEPGVRQQGVDGSWGVRWTCGPIAARSTERQAPDWQTHAPRLRWTTCPSARAFVTAHARVLEPDSPVDPALVAWVKEVVKDELDPAEQFAVLAERLQARFNTVANPLAQRGLTPRPIADIFASNYGNRSEAAVLWAAAFEALGAEVDASIVVDRRDWDPGTPTNTALDGVALQVTLGDTTQWWHPAHGRFENPGTLGHRALLRLDANGGVASTSIDTRGDNEVSSLRVTGRLKIDAAGAYTGDLRMDLTGAYFDPLAVDTLGGQERALQRLAGTVLDGAHVASHSIEHLSPARFSAVVAVTGETEDLQGGQLRRLALGDGPALPDGVNLPLERTRRVAPVAITRVLNVEIRLRLEWADEWSLAAGPASRALVEQRWGELQQTTETGEHEMTVTRHLRLAAAAIAPADFEPLRDALNDLHAPGARTILLHKADP